MIITKIKSLDRKRFEVYLDDKLAFILYRGELRSFNIQENSELSIKDYKEITNNILPKRAVLRLGHLLEKRDYTEYQLRDKLKKAFYPDASIDYAINKVKNYGFINDQSYAERYIEGHIGKESITAIKRKLFQKGILKEDIENALQIVDENGIEQDEDEMVKKLLIKRHYFDRINNIMTNEHDNLDEDTGENNIKNRRLSKNDLIRKENAKQYSYLVSKGFSKEAIIKQLNSWENQY